MQNVQGKGYRLEERYVGPNGDELLMPISHWDGKPLTAVSAWRLFQFSRRQYPGRYDSVDGRPAPYRLVLIGPGHTVAPPSVVDGPML